jgi:hypothetical protein
MLGVDKVSERGKVGADVVNYKKYVFPRSITLSKMLSRFLNRLSGGRAFWTQCCGLGIWKSDKRRDGHHT